MGQRYRTVLVTLCLMLAWLAGTSIGVGMTTNAGLTSIAHADSTAAASTIPPNSVSVSASGSVTVAPDKATVTFGVLVTKQDAYNAQVAANQVIAAAVKNLHALHIPDRMIQTASISLQPQYDNSGNVTGYQASQTLAVVTNTIAQVGRIVDAGVSAGANNNVSISFGLQNENAARIAALKVAVSTARAKAQAAAAALGYSLKGAHAQLSESNSAAPQPVLNERAVMAPGAATASSTQALGGTLTVEEDVTLTYTF